MTNTGTSENERKFTKLSEQVHQLSNPQRSDTFVRNFRDAVREGEFQAVYLPGERFTLPKQYSRRGSQEQYQKETKDMLFEVTEDFLEWFAEQNRSLAVARRGGTLKPTIENVRAGLVDFDELARQTREKMKISHAKGQALGHSRKGKKPAKTRRKS